MLVQYAADAQLRQLPQEGFGENKSFRYCCFRAASIIDIHMYCHYPYTYPLPSLPLVPIYTRYRPNTCILSRRWRIKRGGDLLVGYDTPR